ncbi:putative glucomannan 4-beta-mannosyltransferase 11 [Wolffia australiana]
MAAVVAALLFISAGVAAARDPFTVQPQIKPSSTYSFRHASGVFAGVWSAVGWGRATLLVPALRVTIYVCLVMLAMQIAEKTFVGCVTLCVKLFRRKPEKVYQWKPIGEDSSEKDSSVFPMVLVQIPMYNEKEVYKLSIGAACRLSWPRDRFVVQVLDDSTDLAVKELVMAECEMWAAEGMNIKYEVRDNRKGYKAGALKEGMKHNYVQNCEYIAMFDADFQPEPDFLQRTIPFLVHNPRIALVQSRWMFVNAGECLMTRMQEMSLNYHFKVEQEGGSSSFAFFGYNGTAGVWRISAIADAGGWYDRTTVEDMDLAVRATLKGWKFVYVGDVKVKSELPSTFKAYRFQQHRWSCGPANLFRKMAREIVSNKTVSWWMKFYLLYHFFLLGKVLVHTLTFVYFCTAIPLAAFAPEVEIPKWGLVYAPLAITILKAIETPRSLHLTVFWVLFENAMSMHRLKAAVIGLLEAGRANEWVVTEKLGDALKAKPTVQVLDKSETLGVDREPLLPISSKPSYKTTTRFWKRLHMPELVWGVLLVCCGFYDMFVTKRSYFVYVLLQAAAFLVTGFDFVGTHVPSF